MSIPQDQVPITNCTGTGVATEFSYEFYAPDIRDVFVEIGGTLVDEAEWRAVKDSDSTGRIIFNTAPEDGAEIKIYRSTPITQETVWQQGQAFYADTVMSAFDKLTMIAQEQRGGEANVPGTVVTAHSATYATSATYASSATRAGSATTAGVASGLTAAAKTDILGSAAYDGPFKATHGGFSPGLRYINISAGGISMNGSSYQVTSGRAAVPDTGGTAYLVGTSSGTGYSFSYTGAEPTSAAGQFYAPIASFADNAVKQIQFGNIVDVTLGGGGGGSGDVNYASSAGVADSLAASAAQDIVDAAVTSAQSGVKTFFSSTERTALAIGSGTNVTYYTTSATGGPNVSAVGVGLGGVIAGMVSAPDGADDTWSMNLTIGDQYFYLLKPVQIPIEVKDGYDQTVGNGVIYSPRIAQICFPVGPDTNFHVYATDPDGLGIGSTALYFYPNKEIV